MSGRPQFRGGLSTHSTVSVRPPGRRRGGGRRRVVHAGRAVVPPPWRRDATGDGVGGQGVRRASPSVRRSPCCGPRMWGCGRSPAGWGVTRARSGRGARRVPRSPNDPHRPVYRASTAQADADERARRPKQAQIASSLPLRREVQNRLKANHSPEQIAGRLHEDFPDDPEMWVSHETIYQALYVQGRGALKRELTRHLRTGRAVRKPHRKADERRGRMPGMVNIAERPAEAEDRAVPGHWEGDLILGTVESGSAPVRDRHPGRARHRVRAAAAPAPATTPRPPSPTR